MAHGAFCLVLHGHLPWVLHHGRWPHGEDWLFETAAATWLPLLEVLGACEREGLRPAWTVGLMPILLEQLGSPRFREGFQAYGDEQLARATRDRALFAAEGNQALEKAAAWQSERILRNADHFQAIGGDIASALARHATAGRIELLGSNATHAYHPLVLHDRCARAQLRAGLACSERHLGHRPRGIWLPECGYRPAGMWRPKVVHGDERDRAGIAELCQELGIAHFVVDSHLVERSWPFAALVPDGLAAPDPRHDLRCWGSVLEPYRIAERGRPTSVGVLARSRAVSEQVWSGEIGYPGDPAYLEFHKRHGTRGLRYWRVSGSKVDLGRKEPYDPVAIHAVAHRQAHHFVDVVEGSLRAHREGSGRYGVVCAPFDAELFGHWWHEGPRFLLEVARRIHHDPWVDPLTLSELFERVPPDKVVGLPEGSWGAGGDHRVWFNDQLTFYWEIAYRAEDRFLDLWHRARWREDPATRELLAEAGRQLLLLQASDWAFVIRTGGAVDYGLRRIMGHAAAFDDLCNGVQDLVDGRDADPVTQHALAGSRLRDPVFPDLDLEWWA